MWYTTPSEPERYIIGRRPTTSRSRKGVIKKMDWITIVLYILRLIFDILGHLQGKSPVSEEKLNGHQAAITQLISELEIKLRTHKA